MTSDLKNPMRFSVSYREIDIQSKLPDGAHVETLEIRPSTGDVLVHWEED